MSSNHHEGRPAGEQAIFNAIDAGNYKQALKLVDKRLGKKPDEFLQVSRRSRDPSQFNSRTAHVSRPLLEVRRTKTPCASPLNVAQSMLFLLISCAAQGS